MSKEQGYETVKRKAKEQWSKVDSKEKRNKWKAFGKSYSKTDKRDLSAKQGTFSKIQNIGEAALTAKSAVDSYNMLTDDSSFGGFTGKSDEDKIREVQVGTSLGSTLASGGASAASGLSKIAKEGSKLGQGATKAAGTLGKVGAGLGVGAGALGLAADVASYGNTDAKAGGFQGDEAKTGKAMGTASAALGTAASTAALAGGTGALASSGGIVAGASAAGAAAAGGAGLGGSLLAGAAAMGPVGIAVAGLALGGMLLSKKGDSGRLR